MLKLSLNEELKLNEITSILRVPGGWIYKFFDGDDLEGTVFVPLNLEFKSQNGKEKYRVL
ncbi:hypothetical protein [Lutibacter flavus]|uniref:Uncharacterized protein n=1 Tax=Lutibacter flavus TaxID=691689 RepID=A0A238Y9R6_9FLAO|nr:hypothetical protein [Lutibacter flavus]SNR67985.1 hypothetical protein SAMN04488111_2417 [Lutibacter flavus]